MALLPQGDPFVSFSSETTCLFGCGPSNLPVPGEGLGSSPGHAMDSVEDQDPGQGCSGTPPLRYLRLQPPRHGVLCSLGLGFLGSYRTVTTCTSALLLNVVTLLLPFLFMPFYWWLKKEWMEMPILGFLSLTRALVASM